MPHQQLLVRVNYCWSRLPTKDVMLYDEASCSLKTNTGELGLSRLIIVVMIMRPLDTDQNKILREYLKISYDLDIPTLTVLRSDQPGLSWL